MKSASIRDLHIRTSELVREDAAGTVKPEVELRPISNKTAKPSFPDLSEVWARFPEVSTDSGRFLEEDR